MLRFYNGFTPEHLDEMTVLDFNQYWKAIEYIEAQEMLVAITAEDYPHLKPNRRKEIYNKLKNAVRGSKTGNLTSPEEIAKAIGAISGR